jgi:cobalt/nickel transport system permease protein
MAVVTGGALSWLASANPDGLEWSMFRTSGKEELEAPPEGLHSLLAQFQQKTAFLPDYGFRPPENEKAKQEGQGETHAAPAESEPWPAVSAGTSASGLIGVAITMFLAGFIGFGLRRWQRKR